MGSHHGAFSDRFAKLKQEYNEANACAICEELNKADRQSPIRQVTHGAGGPDGSRWYACWEHYKIVSAFKRLEWICSIRPVGHAPKFWR